MTVTPIDGVLPREPVTVKFREDLDAFLPAGWSVGLAGTPRDAAGALVKPPYFVLYPLTAELAGADEGWGERRHEDVRWVYQVTCLALRGDQLDWMRDRVIRFVLGKDDAGDYARDLDTPEVKIMERTLAEDSGIGESDVAGVIPSDLRFALYATRADTAP